MGLENFVRLSSVSKIAKIFLSWALGGLVSATASYVIKTKDQVPLQVFARGALSRPVIFLVQPVALPHTIFEPIANYLSDRFYVLTYNPRGFDLPLEFDLRNCDIHRQGQDIVDILTSMCIDNCIVIGWCTGSLIALSAAAIDPVRIKRLILAAPGGPKIPNVKLAIDAKAAYELSSVIWKKEKMVEAIVALQKKSMAQESHPSKIFFRNVVDEADRADPDFMRRRFLLMYQVFHDDNIFFWLPEVHTPCDILIAEDDEVVPPDSVKAFSSYLKEVKRVQYFPGVHASFCTDLSVFERVAILMEST